MADIDNFEQVDINSFFDNDYQNDDTGKVVIFTKKQQVLVNQIIPIIQEKDKDTAMNFINRIVDMEALAAAINRFPSLLERHSIIGDIRTPNSLVESLIDHLGSNSTLQLPSKANLGKALLIAKMHTLSRFTQQARHLGEKSLAQAFETETISSMFSLLVEDVYLNLIPDSTQPVEFRKEWALSLLLLWEHWSDQNIEELAPVLQSVWTARRKLAPAFGTMMGTSELLLVSIQMDEQWTSFIKEKLGDPDVSQAMEEFLFGISYEQINKLKGILKNQGIKAIGRDEVSTYLGERVKTDISLDYRDFYLLYTVRRDNARARRRLNVEGPKKTLEDHFIRFVMEQQTKQTQSDRSN